jgi:hypothetical protein
MQIGLNSDPIPYNDFTAITASGATTDQTSADFVNLTGKGLRVVLDMTSAGTGSVVIHIRGKDPASGKYQDLLVGANVTSISTNTYVVYPTITASANAIAQDVLPHTFDILVHANNANATTYTVGCSILQ